MQIKMNLNQKQDLILWSAIALAPQQRIATPSGLPPRESSKLELALQLVAETRGLKQLPPLTPPMLNQKRNWRVR